MKLELKPPVVVAKVNDACLPQVVRFGRLRHLAINSMEVVMKLYVWE